MRTINHVLMIVLVGSICVLVVDAQGQKVGAPVNAPVEKEAALTEIQKLKAENHRLRVAVAQLQAQVNECVLNGERALLTDEFMKSLGGKPGEMFDWNTLTVQKEKK